MGITPEQHLREARTYLDAARTHLGEFERTSAFPPSNRDAEVWDAVSELLDTDLDQSYEWKLAPATPADENIPWDDIGGALVKVMARLRTLRGES